MVFEKAGKFLKETGEKIVGRGPEVKFRNTVDDYARDHGTTREVAEKKIFNDYISSVGRETRTGALDSDSKKWRDFQAAINETLSKSATDRATTDAKNPAVFRNLTFSVSAAQEKQQEKYYQKKFNGDAPDRAIIEDSAENIEMMNRLLRRLNLDITSNMSNTDDLEALLRSHPEMGADIGKLFQSKQNLEKHERMFGRELQFEKSLEQLKKTSAESLQVMLLDAPMKMLGGILGGAWQVLQQRNLNGFFSAMKSSLKALGAGTAAAAKLFGASGKTAALYLNTFRK